ncbi:MAG: HD-GYP domain-containing protein [Thermacetogeniaceae bacterium]
MRIRIQEAAFITVSAAITVALMLLTWELGRKAALLTNTPVLSHLQSHLFGVWGITGGIFFLFLIYTGKVCLKCRSLQIRCEAAEKESERAREEAARISVAAVKALAATLEARDREMLGSHLARVACYSLALARELGLSPEETAEIYYASMLHDIGKIGISEEILNKTSPLTKEEREEIRKHPEIGTGIVRKLLDKENILLSILHHHEWYDGTGYPSGLARQEIPLGARIISIADAYDAMTSNRPYRPAYTHEQAIVELIRNAGKQFDPYLLMRFLDILERGEIRRQEEFSTADHPPVFEFFSSARRNAHLH